MRDTATKYVFLVEDAPEVVAGNVSTNGNMGDFLEHRFYACLITWNNIYPRDIPCMSSWIHSWFRPTALICIEICLKIHHTDTRETFFHGKHYNGIHWIFRNSWNAGYIKRLKCVCVNFQKSYIVYFPLEGSC